MTGIDHSRLMAEIEEEVRARRARGDLTPEFERQLDLAFARYAPVDAVQGDFDVIVAKLEESTTVDTRADTTSSRPGVAQFKRVVGKAIDWDLRHLASQVSGLTHATVRALRLLGDRVDALELDAPAATERAFEQVGKAGQQLGLSAGWSPVQPWADAPWGPFTLSALAGEAAGRYLHADCGDGRLVALLGDAGLDAYGVEADQEVALAASTTAIDVRADDVSKHLGRLNPASLAGLVLSGCVERLSPGALVVLADLAASRVAPGGTVVVLSAHPGTWARSGDRVAQDLSPGRPLHPETWIALLSSRGLVVTDRLDGPPGAERLELLASDEAPGAASHTGVLNSNLAQLNELLYGPAAYAVVARR